MFMQFSQHQKGNWQEVILCDWLNLATRDAPNVSLPTQAETELSPTLVRLDCS